MSEVHYYACAMCLTIRSKRDRCFELNSRPYLQDLFSVEKKCSFCLLSIRPGVWYFICNGFFDSNGKRITYLDNVTANHIRLGYAFYASRIEIET